MGRRVRRLARRLLHTARTVPPRVAADVRASPGALVRNLRSHDRRLKNSLAGMAIAANWQSDGATDDFLRQLAVSLHRLPARRVVVFAAPGVRSLTTLIVNRWADARVLQIGGSAPATGSSDAVQTSTRITYSAATSVSSRHALLTAEGPFDALIDNTLDDVDQQVARLRETLFHVLRRGVYIARTRPEPDSSGATTFGDAVAGILGAGSSSSGSPNTQSFSRDDPSYASAIGRVHRHRSSVHLSVTSSALPKTRYHEADQMMALRPDRVGSVHATRPAIRFGSACVVTANRPEQNRRMPAQFDVPAMALRSYHDVVCAPHQVLIKDGFLLPDSFRHPANARLKNHVLTDLTPLFARYPGRLAAPGRLDGDYFYLGSEYPQLFGHVMTEQLSRLWAWRDAKLAHPGLKALVPLRSRKTRLTSFEKEIFTAAGVGEADIVTTVGPVRVDHLLAASPMLVNPQYIHPGIRVQWDEVGSTLIRAAPDHETPRKIFVARKPSHTKRACHNADEVEASATRLGFAVVFPEDYSLPEQVQMFRQADVVAGYAGSGLFTLCLCPLPKRLVLISSENYTARNEYLIASVLGHRMDIIWCPADVPFRDGVWTNRAFQSDYRVDLARDGALLEGLLTG